MKELAEIRDLAKKNRQLTAAIKAEELRGFYADTEQARAKANQPMGDIGISGLPRRKWRR